MDLIHQLMKKKTEGELDRLDQLEPLNRLTEPYGLSLSVAQMQHLMEQRHLTLKNTGRVEFGEGILPKLIYAFCDSPYILQQDFEETLMELQEMFYYFKTESLELISDDELIDVMKKVFDGKGQGSLAYLSETALEEFCREARSGFFEGEDVNAANEEEENLDGEREGI